MSVLISVQTVCHSDSDQESLFLKLTLKKSAYDNKTMKIPRMQRVNYIHELYARRGSVMKLLRK